MLIYLWHTQGRRTYAGPLYRRGVRPFHLLRGPALNDSVYVWEAQIYIGGHAEANSEFPRINDFSGHKIFMKIVH